MEAVKIRQVGPINQYSASVSENTLYLASIDSSSVGLNIHIISVLPEDRS